MEKETGYVDTRLEDMFGLYKNLSNRKKRCFVFDIDGTLADGSHRKHFLQGKPANWDAYNSAMNEDTVVEPVFRVLDALVSVGENVVFLSGREGTNQNRYVTVNWIKSNLLIKNPALYMREAKDFRSDDVVKLELMQNFVLPEYDVTGIFDDRPKVVRMWRQNGFFVFDVHQTGEEF